jgi:hypothetical protein
MTQICIVPVYLFTGVLIERIKAQVERLRGSIRSSPSRWAALRLRQGHLRPARRQGRGHEIARKAACSNATAASTAKPPRPSTCTTTAIRRRPLQAAHTRTVHDHAHDHAHIMVVPPTRPDMNRHDLPSNTVTEQLTAAGRAIEHDSFAIIDAEVGPHAYTAEQWPLVRRMIHANADFEFNGLTAFHPMRWRPAWPPSARAARRSSPTSK